MYSRPPVPVQLGFVGKMALRRPLNLSQIIFNIVEGLDPSPLEPDSTMSEADVVVGAHATLNCVIMVGFSIFFHHAYSVTPYIIDEQVDPENGSSQDQHYQGGFLGINAWVGMLNPMEIISAAASIFNLKSGGPMLRTTVIEGASDDRHLICQDSYEMDNRDGQSGSKRDGSQHVPCISGLLQSCTCLICGGSERFGVGG